MGRRRVGDARRGGDGDRADQARHPAHARVARWKPWDLASRVGTVDRLSGGRAILGAGLGALHDGWLAFEADEGRKTRAEKVDEGLAIYAGLMAGQPFEFEGTHYSAEPTDFMLPDPPVQRPHPPVWVVGAHMVGRHAAAVARARGPLGRPDPAVVDRATASGASATSTTSRDDRRPTCATCRTDAGLPWEGYDVVLEADSTRRVRQARAGRAAGLGRLPARPGGSRAGGALTSPMPPGLDGGASARSEPGRRAGVREIWGEPQSRVRATRRTLAAPG